MADIKKKRPGRVENLQPVRTKEEARERGRAGGKASGKARKEKKLMSQIYAEFLAKEHNVKLPGGRKKELTTGYNLINAVAVDIIKKGGGTAVSLMKEIREATEGNKLNIDADVRTDSEFKIVKKDEN